MGVHSCIVLACTFAFDAMQAFRFEQQQERAVRVAKSRRRTLRCLIDWLQFSLLPLAPFVSGIALLVLAILHFTSSTETAFSGWTLLAPLLLLTVLVACSTWVSCHQYRRRDDGEASVWFVARLCLCCPSMCPPLCVAVDSVCSRWAHVCSSGITNGKLSSVWPRDVWCSSCSASSSHSATP